MTRNVFGIHTSNSDYPQDIIEELLSVSALVKVCVNFNDALRLARMRELAHSSAVFVGRHIAVDIEGGPLHNLYSRLGDDDLEGAYRLGVWFAHEVADRALPAGLGWMYWESGPNETTCVSRKAAQYAMGFIETCLARGIKPAVGGYPYGTPRTPPIDSVDDWSVWEPVFSLIDRANKYQNGAYRAEPEAIFYLHEYAQNSMVASETFAIRRYTHVWKKYVTGKGRWVPLALSEFGWANDRPGLVRPNVESATRQLVAVNEDIAQDDYVIGYAVYDYRNVSNSTFYDMRGYAKSFVVAMKAQRYERTKITPPGIIEVPPVVYPGGKVTVTVRAGVNQRAQASILADKLGYIEAASPPTLLVVEYPPTNGYVKVSGQPFWVLEKNLQRKD